MGMTSQQIRLEIRDELNQLESLFLSIRKSLLRPSPQLLARSSAIMESSKKIVSLCRRLTLAPEAQNDVRG